MKIKRSKGMRDIPTIQGLNSRHVPDTRPQAAVELARLENEKVRLERELKLWGDHQRRTEGRLQQVEERLAVVTQVLVPLATEGSTKPVLSAAEGPAKIRRSPTEKADSGEGEAQGWQEIQLEY